MRSISSQYPLEMDEYCVVVRDLDETQGFCVGEHTSFDRKESYERTDGPGIRWYWFQGSSHNSMRLVHQIRVSVPLHGMLALLRDIERSEETDSLLL